MIYENVNERLLQGAAKLANVVGATMGPKGENVIINRLSGNPTITKDGVTVARNIELEDRVENIAVRIIKEVALNVVDEAGDGTTTATVLAEAFLRYGKELLNSENCTISANELKNYFQQLVDLTIKGLEKIKIDITEDNQHLLNQVAIISANNDKELGNIIYEAISGVGIDGVVKVVQSTNKDTYVSFIEGISYPNGYLNQYLTNSPNSNKVEYKNVKVALFNKKLESLKEVKAVLSSVQDTEPIFFIASDYSEEVISMLVINNNQKSRVICAIRAPEFGDYRQAVLLDYALYTGARVCTVTNNFESAKDLGKLESIIVTKKDHTLFMHEDRKKTYSESIGSYIDVLKALLKEADNDFDAEKLRNRIAKLQGSVALIHVGAKSELELSEKLDRVEDSLLATQAAVKEGILPGGGSALLHGLCLGTIEYDNANEMSLWERFGEEVVATFARIVEAPLRKIYSNANLNYEEVSEYIDTIYYKHGVKDTSDGINYEKFKKEAFKGINIATFNTNEQLENQEKDLLEEGIIDPFLVTKSALLNAVSIASLLMTTNNVVEHFDEATPYYS